MKLDEFWPHNLWSWNTCEQPKLFCVDPEVHISMNLKRVTSFVAMLVDYLAIDLGVSEFSPAFGHMSLSLSWGKTLTKGPALLLAED